MSRSSDMQLEILAHQFNAARYGDLIYIWLSEAQEKIAREVDMRVGVAELSSSITVNQHLVTTLPDDFLRVKFCWVTSSTESYRIPNTDATFDTSDELFKFTQDHGTTNETGNPEAYALYGNSLYIFPWTTGTWTVRLIYYKSLTAIDAATNPITDISYDHILKAYALYKIFESEHDIEMAMYHKGVFDQEFIRAKGQLQTDSYEPPVQVQGMLYYEVE